LRFMSRIAWKDQVIRLEAFFLRNWRNFSLYLSSSLVFRPEVAV
jgi:hypothetical protein